MVGRTAASVCGAAVGDLGEVRGGRCQELRVIRQMAVRGDARPVDELSSMRERRMLVAQTNFQILSLIVLHS